MTFRFHTGSIRSAILDSVYGESETSFDSILVRLEAKAVSFFMWLETFRFHTGSIRRNRDDWIIRPMDTGFDSILVRLEGKPCRRRQRCSLHVSIPYWFD